MKTIPDELIYRATGGDMDAFEAIYRLTAGFVYAVSYRVVYSREDAEEVTQDVFIKVYDNLKKFKEGTSFKAWIYRIAVNTAINYYNKKKRDITHDGDYEIASELYGKGPEVEENLQAKHNEEKVEELLSRLNPDQKACMVLREIEGMSYEEIAKVLNIKINTVRTRLKRAREALVKYVKNKGVGYEV